MKILKNKILKMILYFIVTIAIFVLLLILSSSFPSRYIKGNVSESCDTLIRQNNNFRVLIRGRWIKFDNYTDALMINTAYSIDNKTPLYSAFTARKNYDSNYTKVIHEDTVGELKWDSKYDKLSQGEELRDILNGNSSEAFEYARYWHGYLAVLRPLLLLFNLSEIRIISIIILNILLVAIIYLMNKKTNKFVAASLFIAFISADVYIIGLSIQGMFVFFIALISSLIVIKKDANFKNMELFFMLIGMITNYLDFLTNPILTFGLPIAIIFLLKQERKENIKVIDTIKIFVKCGISWVIGYGMTWIMKWILFDGIYGRNLIKTAILQVRYRSNIAYIEYYISAVLYNYAMNIEFIFLFIVLISINLVVFGLLKKNKMKISFKIKEELPYIILGIIPLIWYFILQNHSLYHNFFTYRTDMLTILALFLISTKMVIKDKS